MISESGGRRTIDQLLRSDESFAAYEGWRYGPIVNLCLDGRRIGTLPSDFGFGDLYQPDVARKKADELLAVANTLIILGMTIADLHPNERPDFIVSTAPASELLVEVTDVVSPCRSDSVKSVMREVRQAVESDSSLKEALEGRSVLVTLQHTATETLPMDALTDDCPGDHINRSASRKLVAEILEFIRRGDIATHVVDKNITIPDTAATRTLARFRAMVTVRNDGRAQAQVSSMRWLPKKTSLYAAAKDALEAKQDRAVGYLRKPDWLLLNVKEQAEDFRIDVEAQGVPLLTPFGRAYILLWRDWALRLWEWS